MSLSLFFKISIVFSFVKFRVIYDLRVALQFFAAVFVVQNGSFTD
jgi:hypothetical protein